MINVTLLRDKTRVKRFGRGTVIAGAKSGVVILAVLKGEVWILAHDTVETGEKITALGTGALYIDASLIDGSGSNYTAIAGGDSIVLPIDVRTLQDMKREEPEIACQIARELSNRRGTAGPTDTCEEKHEIVETAAQKMPESIKLFPEGHSDCRLPFENQDAACLMSKTITCPVCGTPFTAISVRQSKLIVEKTESDMRQRYKGVEPYYYEVLTCPNCFYSAVQETFEKPERRRQDVLRELSGIAGSLRQIYTSLSESEAVFARYYLALRCAPLAFGRPQYVSAKLYYILSRLYQDAENGEMEAASARRALEAFRDAYEKERLAPKQEQQACVLIGELYLKQNALKDAVTYFSKVRENAEKTSALRRHAENRIYDIRAMAGAQ